MVKHIILWKIDDKYSVEEKQKIKSEAKSALEGLNGKIEGLVEIKVQTDSLASSNADMLLYSVFESEQHLKGYSVHECHVKAADTFVRPFTVERLCLDFEI